MASPKTGRQLERVMRDWRGIKAAIGDRVFYVSVDATCEPAILEAWVEEVDAPARSRSPPNRICAKPSAVFWGAQSRCSSHPSWATLVGWPSARAIRSSPASRSAPKIGHRRSQNRAIRTHASQHDHKSER
jgi:hypothetical protein